MICQQVREEIAVGLLTGVELDELVTSHIATCPACAAEQANLRRVQVVMEQASASDFTDGPKPSPNELHLRRILDAAAAERAQDHRRTRMRVGLAVAAAAVVGVVGVGVGLSATGPDQMISASASANGLSATAEIAPQNSGSNLKISVTGVPRDTDCILLVHTADGQTQRIVEWRSEYGGPTHVSGAADAAPSAITSVTLTEANGSVLLDIPVST